MQLKYIRPTLWFCAEDKENATLTLLRCFLIGGNCFNSTIDTDYKNSWFCPPQRGQQINTKHCNSQLHVSKNTRVTCKALRGSRVHSSLYKQICARPVQCTLCNNAYKKGVEKEAHPSAHLRVALPYRPFFVRNISSCSHTLVKHVCLCQEAYVGFTSHNLVMGQHLLCLGDSKYGNRAVWLIEIWTHS